MRAVVFTLGCKVNECESDSLITGLKQKGYEVFDKLVPADLYIINTCAVTQEAEKKSRQTASRIKKLSPNAKIIFTGCACQKSPQDFLKKGKDVLVTGTFNKNAILKMLEDSGERISPETKIYEELLPSNGLRTRTYIKVQDGCDNFCSYCIIPYLRGRSRSRNPKSVKCEIQTLKPIEAIINGINLSSYNYDGKGLSGLLNCLSDIDCRIRLGSLEVNIINEEFLESAKNLKNFAPHFHLSLQSGSNYVLKKMNRRYTREEFIEKVKLIRKYFPDAGITTDIIAGYPAETEQDFLDTVDLAKTVEFSDIHPFIFSPRSGTVGAKLKDLDYDIKKKRLDILLEIKKELKEKFALSMKDKILEFIPEEENGGFVSGYTQNYLRVYIDTNELPEKAEKRIYKIKIDKPLFDGALAHII